MKYKNAQDILPDKLLKELQKYISGETVYIPNIQQKAAWGGSIRRQGVLPGTE